MFALLATVTITVLLVFIVGKRVSPLVALMAVPIVATARRPARADPAGAAGRENARAWFGRPSV
jgi:Mg2+/citrate symporter